jgi:hypothetical protein
LVPSISPADTLPPVGFGHRLFCTGVGHPRRDRKVIRVVANLVWIAALLAAAPATASPRQQFFGVDLAGQQDSADFREMSRDGVATARFELKWASVQKAAGPPRWTPTDGLVGRLASQGLRPVPFIWGSPKWVTDAQSHPPIENADQRAAWRSFLTQLVDRYGLGGTYWAGPYQAAFGVGAPIRPITAWQIWNEPNIDIFFQSSGQRAEEYVKLLRISRAAIKGANPRAKILAAGLVGNGSTRAWDFLNELYGVPGFKKLADATALHPFAFNTRQVRGMIRKFRRVMKLHGDAETPLWITELGWGSGPRYQYLNYGLQGQKRRLRRAFLLVLRHRDSWRVPHLFWFEWRDPAGGAGDCSWCDTSGLRANNHDPKPALRAFRRLAPGLDQTFSSPSSPYAKTVLGTSGLAHYWRLGEPRGRTAIDAKGSADGTYKGGFNLARPGAIASDPNTSASLDGSSGHLSTPVNPGGSQGTIEFWGYATDLGSRNAFVYTADNGTTSYSHQIGVLSDGSVRLYIVDYINDGTPHIVDTPAGLISPSTWHHYALVWSDGGTADLYVDGTKRASVDIQTSWNEGDKLLFGHAAGVASGLTKPWQGRIDEAAVYNTALSATAIQRHYEEGLGD